MAATMESARHLAIDSNKSPQPHKDTHHKASSFDQGISTASGASPTVRILIVEDNPGDARLIVEYLNGIECGLVESRVIDSLDLVKSECSKLQFDMIFLDLSLPGSNGLTTLTRAIEFTGDTPIIVLTGHADIKWATGAIKIGATDYLCKDDIGTAVLDRTVRYALDRRRAAAFYKAMEDQSRQVIEKNADAVLVVSKEGLIRFVNPAACSLFDRLPQQLIGTEFGFPIGHANDSAEIEICKERNQLAYGEMRVSPIRWQGEDAFIASIRDITQRKQLEEEVKVKSAFESVAVLSAGVAHDYNNLMAGILGYIELARYEVRSDTHVRPHLDRAVKHIHHAKDLTARFLALANGPTLNVRRHSIEPAIQNLLKLAHAYKGIRVICNIQTDIWEANYDRQMMDQVFKILAKNAYEAIEGNGVLAIGVENVSLQHQVPSPNKRIPKGNYVRIIISDSGKGIPPDLLTKIFNPYFSTKKLGNVKGRGMSLAVCYAIMEKHDGHIFINSKPGEGTAVTLYLRANLQEHLAGLATVPASRQTGKLDGRGRPRSGLPIIRLCNA